VDEVLKIDLGGTINPDQIQETASEEVDGDQRALPLDKV